MNISAHPNLLIVVLASLAIGGCAAGEAREAAAADAPLAGVVDSILPPKEALRRFRADLPEVTALTGGASSRDALVRRFLSALEARDTATLREMVLSRAEYAWLYYPASAFAREPYYQMPQLNWFLNIEDSQKGITRLFTRYGGRDLQFASYECPQAERFDGGLRMWDRCVVSFVHDGAEKQMRMFGSIAERNGQFKFYSYVNDL
jgi:hypothetical protein